MSSSEEIRDTCYVCLSEETHYNRFITESPCDCKGTINIHWNCFTQYRNTNSKCGICKNKYTFNIITPLKGGTILYKDITVRKEYKSNGELVGEGQIIDGKKHGHWKEYVILQFYSLGKGIYTNGLGEGIYINGLKEGVWKIVWTANAQEYNAFVEEGKYINGKREGFWKRLEKYSDETQKQGLYVNGLKEGHWKSYMIKSGILEEEGSYDNGKKNGIWKLYHKSGNIRTETNHNSVSKSRSEKTYYESGILQEEASYDSKGFESGIWKRYYESGNIQEIIHFDWDDDDHGRIGYYESGALSYEEFEFTYHDRIKYIKSYDESDELKCKKCDAIYDDTIRYDITDPWFKIKYNNEYYESGALSYEECKCNGCDDCIYYKSYYESGALKSKLDCTVDPPVWTKYEDIVPEEPLSGKKRERENESVDEPNPKRFKET